MKLDFNGGLTFNNKKFRIDCQTFDEPVIIIDFITDDDPYKLTKEEKLIVGEAALNGFMKVLEARTCNSLNPSH